MTKEGKKVKIVATFKPERLIKRMETQAPPLSVRELGKMTGVSSSTIGFIKSGKTAVPRSDTLAILCYAMGVNPLDLFEFEGGVAGPVKEVPPATGQPPEDAAGKAEPEPERKMIRHKKADGTSVEAEMPEAEPDEGVAELSEAVDGVLDDDDEDGLLEPTETEEEAVTEQQIVESPEALEPESPEPPEPEPEAPKAEDEDEFDDMWDFD